MAIQDLVCGQGAREAAHMARLVLRRGSALTHSAVATAIQRAVERRELQALDYRMRRDARIGLCEAHELARKLLWRA